MGVIVYSVNRIWFLMICWVNADVKMGLVSIKSIRGAIAVYTIWENVYKFVL